MIREVPAESLHRYWPQIEPLIAKALSHGQGDEATPAHIARNIMQGVSHLWAIVEDDRIQAVCVVSVIDTMVRKVFVEVLAGENMSAWVAELQQALADYRDLLGARCVEASCRPGLVKVLKKMGWKSKATIMELSDG